jgi:hypothetical protein
VGRQTSGAKPRRGTAEQEDQLRLDVTNPAQIQAAAEQVARRQRELPSEHGLEADADLGTPFT